MSQQRNGFQRVASGSPWEERFSYSRAVRAGHSIYVSGTVAMKDGQVFAPGDARAQTLRVLEIIESALKELGCDRTNVVRTRMFVTDISRSEEFGVAHGEFFRGCAPATAMYEVKALISPDFLIEIEADAVAGINEQL